MAFDVKFLKKHGNTSRGIFSTMYTDLSKREKMKFNAHNRLDKKYSYQINYVKYSKDLEIKAMYHGTIAESMLRKRRALTKQEKEKIYKECKKFLN